jgi:tRNA dimethylallyltransferase
MEQVIIIVGPTCSGKTKLSLKLAEILNTEIISADSRQVYRYLDIGTATPSATELKKIKHYFINSLDPDNKFNVSDFETDALKIIQTLHTENKIPIVAGGSGLYIKALVDGIFNTVDKDDELRKKMMIERIEKGNDYLYSKLKEVDPVSAKTMLPQNYKRIVRALEVYYLTGKPIWELQQEYNRDIKIDFVQYGLNWERNQLYRNIETRVDEMLESGLVNEVKNILKKGFRKNLNALNTVGYKEIISYLDGEIPIERAAELIKRNTRRYAKRQLTWFNRDKRIKWIKVGSDADIIKASDMILSDIKK